jgi:hypothetical protein
MGVTQATCEASIERRLRRTLTDARLHAASCYLPALHRVLDWTALLHGSGTVSRIVAESDRADRVRLL